MFLRQYKRPKGTYLAICESFRDPQSKQPRSRIIRTLGYVQDLISEDIPDPISFYKQQISIENERLKSQQEHSTQQQISDVSPLTYLGYFPAQAILKKLDVASQLDIYFQNRKFAFSVRECLFALVYSRLVHPASKYGTWESVFPRLFQAPSFSYDQVLACLDAIGQEYEKIVELFTFQTNETYILDTSKTYFDCTNYYFEIDAEDEWRRKGPSKENRKDPIIGMGLLLDANCIPIGMRLYPGNASEKPVMRSLIKDMKKQNNITGRTVTVADKGLNCAQNIKEAVDAGDGYIFSKSVKQLPQKEKTWVLLEDGYSEIRNHKGEVKFKIKSCVDVFNYEYTDENKRKHKFSVKERRVATYNPALARKQKIELQKLVEKASGACLSKAKKDELGECSKYIQYESVGEDGNKTGKKVAVSLDYEKIEKDKACCGYNLMVSSEISMSALDIYDTYHELWRIEESFRTLKSELDARPVYLQTANRIKGHFLICYLSVLVERLFQFKVLEGKYCSHQVYKFMRDFQVIKLSETRYMNVSTTSDIIKFLDNKYSLCLGNLYMNHRQIERLLERNL